MGPSEMKGNHIGHKLIGCPLERFPGVDAFGQEQSGKPFGWIDVMGVFRKGPKLAQISAKSSSFEGAVPFEPGWSPVRFSVQEFFRKVASPKVFCRNEKSRHY